MVAATSRGSVLSLVVILAGIVILPTGPRAVNRLLLDDTVKPSYLPTVETPRPREPFDEETAATLRGAQPEFIVIGDSMAGTRINTGHLSRKAGRSVAGLFVAGSPVAYWYDRYHPIGVGSWSAFHVVPGSARGLRRAGA